MGTELLRYDRMVQDALRGVVRDALSQVAEYGLPPRHHFFVTFRTDHIGVEMPDYLRERYPEEMTIVLQNQFWGLEIGEESFSVTLSFDKSPAGLTVPFTAVTRFVDPPVNFGLQLTPVDENGVALEPASPEPASSEPASLEPGAAPAKGGDESGEPKVVALDSFRKH